MPKERWDRVYTELVDARRIARNINAAADPSNNGPELMLLEDLDDALAALMEKP